MSSDMSINASNDNEAKMNKLRLHQLLSARRITVTPQSRQICDIDIQRLHDQMVSNKVTRDIMRQKVRGQLDEFGAIPLTPALVPDDDSDDFRQLYLEWLADYWIDGHEFNADQLIDISISSWFIATTVPSSLSKPLVRCSRRSVVYAILIPREVHIFNAYNWNTGLALNSNSICYLYYYYEGSNIRPGTNHPNHIVACPGLREVLESEQL